MSRFNHVFDGKESETFECEYCNSLAVVDDDGKLMRMIFNVQGLPIIYEEKDKEKFVRSDGSLRCDCQD